MKEKLEGIELKGMLSFCLDELGKLDLSNEEILGSFRCFFRAPISVKFCSCLLEIRSARNIDCEKKSRCI